MAEFRWLLLAAGALVLAVVFWLSRREARGSRAAPTGFLKRAIPPAASASEGAGQSPTIEANEQKPLADLVVTVRLMARGSSPFPGDRLVLALRDAGLKHGRFGIFHRHEASDEGLITFSVASLVEPGSFDLSRLKDAVYPGVSLFLMLPGPKDPLAAFDDMLATARLLAEKLDGELLDEHGSRLSVQRERYLREEVIQYPHKQTAP